MAHNGFAQIFSTNSPPNPGEIVAIKTHMHLLADSMAQARERLQELEAEYERYRACLSAIRRIPVEILGEIFYHAAPSRRELVKLELVCTKWREAALLSHQLWSRVDIRQPSNLGKHVYPRIAKWLSRSGCVPRILNVSEDVNRPCKEGSRHCVFENATILKLLTVGPSIGELNLSDLKGRGCFQNLKRLMGAPLEEGPYLRPWDCIRSLWLDFDNGVRWTSRDAQVPHQESILGDLPPSLEVLKLSLPGADEAFEEPSTSNLINFNVPSRTLERLTHLEITCDWEGAHLLYMLEHCKNLEHLELNALYTELTFGEQDTTLSHRISGTGIVLPMLKTLKLEHHLNLGYLEHLVAPALTTLDIGFTGSDERPAPLSEYYIHTHLHDFIVTRSKCTETLHTLRIYNTGFSAHELASILFELPAIEHLTLDRIDVPWVALFKALQDNVKVSNASRGGLQSSPPCLARLATLQLFQLRLPVVEVLDAVFQFLHERGPQKCQFVTSFEPPEVAPSHSTVISENWISAVTFSMMDRGEDGMGPFPSLEDYGISFRIDPVDNHGHY